MSSASNSSSSGSRWARTKTKTFLESNRQNLFRTIEKSSNRLVTVKFKKKELKNTHFHHFPRPGESYPYMNILKVEMFLLESSVIVSDRSGQKSSSDLNFRKKRCRERRGGRPLNMFKTTKFGASVFWGSSQHPFIREGGWSNTCTIYEGSVEYTCCEPAPEPVGPSDFLPSGLGSPTRCLLCRQTNQQSKSRIFIETGLLKPLRFSKNIRSFETNPGSQILKLVSNDEVLGLPLAFVPLEPRLLPLLQRTNHPQPLLILAGRDSS